MQNTNTSKMSTWTFWAPFKFAITTFCAMTIVGLTSSYIATRIYAPAQAPHKPILLMCFFIFICCSIRLIKKLPRPTPDQTSFVATHNIQTLITSTLLMLISYIILQNLNNILIKMMIMATTSTPTFILTTSTFMIIFLYIIGTLFSNIYLKVCRTRTFNIPTWKIICSMPFGFSALWIPGYILKSNKKEKDTITIKSNWYKNITNKILCHKTNTIIVFALITTLSGYTFGTNSVLLTFIFALIFGIWALQINTKKFIQIMPNKYSTFAIIMNIAIIIILAVGTYIYKIPTPTTTINITETTMDSNP